VLATPKLWISDYFAVPGDLARPQRRWYTVGSYAYPLPVFWHFVFIFIFAGLGAWYLAWLNIASCIAHAGSMFLHHRRRYYAAFALTNTEIILHTVLAVRAFGWDSGFQYYTIVAASAVFLSPPVA
jgi:hypothetical protein